PEEGLATRIGRGAALGAAAGLGIPESPTPVRDLASGLNQQVNQAVGGWNRWSTPRTAPQVDKDTGFTMPGTPTGPPGWGEGGPIYGTLALIGNMLKGAVQGEVQSGKEVYQGVKQRDPELVAHGATSGIVRPLTALAGAESPDAITGVPENVRSGAQSYLRIGKDFVKEGAEKVGEENAAAWAKHQDKLASIREANAQQQGNYQQRQQMLDISNQHIADVSRKLPMLRDQAIAEGKAMYPKIAGTVPATEIASGLTDAMGKLQGTENYPTVIKRILDDLNQQNPLNQASVFKGAGRQARGPAS